MLIKRAKDIYDGNFLSNDELNEEEDKWLSDNLDKYSKKKPEQKYFNIGLNITDHLSIQKNIKITKTKGRTSAIRH